AKDLYAVVGPVAHIHIALRIDGHISGTVQLALAGAITAAKLYQEITLWGELLHPVVLMVGDVHITLVVYRNTPGGIELPRGAAEATPGAEEFAVFGDLLYTVVAAINDIQDVLLVDSNPRGAIELTVTAPSRAPVAQIVAVLIEDGDAVEPLVGNVHVFLAIEGYAGGPDHFPRTIASTGEIAYYVLRFRLRWNNQFSYARSQLGLVPGHVLHLLPAAVDGIDGIALTCS